MTLLGVSINHRTADLGLLARASMDSETSRQLASGLVSHPHVGEALVLSTCNRTEVYVDTDRFHAGLEAIALPLAERAGVERSELPDICHVFYDEAAVQHCFGLVSGLDSLVIGETQILGQVRESLSVAQQDHTSGPAINQLFQTALRVGKRVQSETAIGAAGRSVLSAALDQLAQTDLEIAGSRVLVVGAGAMAGLAARTLASQGAHVDCANRTLSKAERLAREVGGVAIGMPDLAAAVADHDVVITCTGASGRLITAETLGQGSVPKAILDVAMPPDVDEDVTTRGVTLINIASLKAVGAQNDIDDDAAKALVGTEVSAYLARQRAQTVTPTVVALRQMARGVVDAEMRRLTRRLPALDEASEREIHNALNRVAEKLIHQPTVRVREFAEEPGCAVDYAAALRSLFSLEPHAVQMADEADCPPEARAAVTLDGIMPPVVEGLTDDQKATA